MKHISSFRNKSKTEAGDKKSVSNEVELSHGSIWKIENLVCEFFLLYTVK